jgi:hypothetical protein
MRIRSKQSGSRRGRNIRKRLRLLPGSSRGRAGRPRRRPLKKRRRRRRRVISRMIFLGSYFLINQFGLFLAVLRIRRKDP